MTEQTTRSDHQPVSVGVTHTLRVAHPADPAADADSAELAALQDKVANLEVALVTSRRIGMAIGILMANAKLTQEDALALLAGHSQATNQKVRDLAETVILTGTLA